MTLYKPFSGASGRSFATPRIRKLTTTLAPTSSPMPTAWRERINQYANIDGESRIHILNPLSSIDLKMMGTAKVNLRVKTGGASYTAAADRVNGRNIP